MTKGIAAILSMSLLIFGAETTVSAAEKDSGGTGMSLSDWTDVGMDEAHIRFGTPSEYEITLIQQRIRDNSMLQEKIKLEHGAGEIWLEASLENGFFGESTTSILKSKDQFRQFVMNLFANADSSFVTSPQKSNNSRGEYLFATTKILGGRECFVARQGMVLGNPWLYDNYTNQFDAHTEYFVCDKVINQKRAQDHFDRLEFSLSKFKKPRRRWQSN